MRMRSLKNQGGWFQYALAGASAVFSYQAAESAGKKNKRLTRENVSLARLDTKQKLEDMAKTYKQVQGEAFARASASGFTSKGSREAYFKELEASYKTNVDWVNKTSRQQIRQIRAGGAYQSDTIKNAGVRGVLGAATQAAGWYYGSK